MLRDTVKTLCSLFGPSGCEDEVRAYIREQAAPFAEELIEDANGSLLILKKGAKTLRHKLLLAAHMDEVGVIVKGYTDDGFLRFAFAGGVDRRVVIGKRVYLGDKRIPGVIGMKPIHLTTKDERKSVPKLDTLYIDIGAKDKKEAEKRIKPGDYGCFDGSCTPLGGEYMRMKAIDDRIGCAILLELIKQELPCDTWFVFTVQEEVGCRGAFGAAFRIEPDVAIVVEGTTAADSPLASEAQSICSPGKGPVLPYMDGGSIYDRELMKLLQSIAEENNIPWQTKTRIAGGTDAQAIQRTGGGCKVGAVSAAVRYIHSPSSVGNFEDFEQMQQIVRGFLEKAEEKYG